MPRASQFIGAVIGGLLGAPAGAVLALFTFLFLAQSGCTFEDLVFLLIPAVFLAPIIAAAAVGYKLTGRR